MTRKSGSLWLSAAMAAIALLAAACGSSSSSGATAKPTITIAGFNFPESSILAEIYGQELAHDGYTIKYKLLLGNRELVAPALENGQIDLYPGYAATELEYYNHGAGEANGDATGTTAKLNSHLASLGLVALDPSAAVDQNAFAVTTATQSQYNLHTLSDLAPIGDKLVLGGPAECPTRPYCEVGLTQTYGIHFKAFKALDGDGPLTRAAFANGSIQVGLVFSSDGDLTSAGLVVLQDDKHLENADNILPVMRTAIATSDVKSILGKVDAGLTTADLITLNAMAGQHVDPDQIATQYLQSHNYFGA